jgi:two-component system cell cycle sensor histidine kinase/response regulator CckA
MAPDSTPPAAVTSPVPPPALTGSDWARIIGVAAVVVLPVLVLPNVDERWSTAGLSLIPAVLAIAATALWLRARRHIAHHASSAAQIEAYHDRERRAQRAQEGQLREEHARALARAERSFERFFEDAPFGIALIDSEAALLEGNRTFRRLAGIEGTTFVGRQLSTLLRAEDQHDIAARLARLASGDAGPGPLEARLRAGDRETVVSIFANKIDRGSGGPHLIVYMLDTTDQKKLETQFAQSQKMQAVGQLAGGIAHDFNNLLTAMIGFCDLLLQRHQPGDASFADIMQIKQNANRAANLVRQLLAFSRQQTLQPKVLDVTDALTELSHLLRRLIGASIELQIVHSRDLFLVRVDQGQLEQVIINLAVNARDAMVGGGRLTIRTRNESRSQMEQRGSEIIPPGDYVVTEVEDSGTGIAPENLVRIFEPFFSTKEVGSGTGLGLSTVYGIVKQTGGFVFVDSVLKKGTTFTIMLPRYHGTRQVETTVAVAADARRDLTGVGTILLVEDEDAVRLFGSRALRNKGYKIVEAKSGDMALEVLANYQGTIDLMITDIVMPQMDGTQLIRHVREKMPDLKVICISGYAEESFRKRLDSEVGIHFLPKPFSLDQLASTVKEVMG